jgi:hypothetical protein
VVLFRVFSSVVRQMSGYKPQFGARPTPFKRFCVALYIVCFVSFCVLFVCKCVLYYCHRVATQLQLTNIYVRLKAKENSACTTEFLRCWYVFIPCISGNGSSPGLLIAFRGYAAMLYILFWQKSYSVLHILQFGFVFMFRFIYDNYFPSCYCLMLHCCRESIVCSVSVLRVVSISCVISSVA